VLATALLLHGSVFAQTRFPAKPVRLVVTLPAGSSPDVMARFVAERLSRDLGQPVIVENKPGASSIIGTDAVAKAPADGYTLLYALSSSVSINPHLFSRLPYKASDFVPIVHLVNVPIVLIVRADSAFKSLDELVQAAKRQPGGLTHASYGEGTQTHLAAVRLVQRTGTTITHIPYKDGGIAGVIGGAVDWTFATPNIALPHVKAGKLRALAVSANKRLPGLPGTPTLSEVLPGMESMESWNGVLAPRGTPSEVLYRLQSALQKIAESSEFRKKALELDLIPTGGTAEDFRSFLAKDYEKWGAVVKRTGIRLDEPVK
jgi:tripartite-type tricarboxylate transporter receptor subunit TctC